jgi:hypothetical protein
LREHLRRGEPFDLEFRVRVESGVFRWFRTRGRAMLGPEGKPERMAGSLTDITERKQAESQIFEEKERAQVTLASIADAVITVDMSGRIEFITGGRRLTADDGRARQRAVARLAVRDENTGMEIADPSSARCASGASSVGRQRRPVPPRRSLCGDRLQRRAHSQPDGEHRRCGARVSRHESRAAIRGAVVAPRESRSTHQLLNRREFERRLTDARNRSAQAVNHAVLYRPDNSSSSTTPRSRRRRRSCA